MNADIRTLLLVALIATAPIAIVLICAILRGYTISLHMAREGSRRPERERD